MSAHLDAPPATTADIMQITQDKVLAHPAFAESAAHLSDMLRGLVSRWETLDFTASANCFAPESRLKAWQEADGAELPRAYERA